MPNPENPIIDDGVAKTNEPVSLTVSEPDAGTRRHEPHEPGREHLPAKLFEKRKTVHNKRIDGKIAMDPSRYQREHTKI